MAAADTYLTEVEGRYESLRYDIERPILEPSTLYLAAQELRQNLNRGRRIFLNEPNAKHAVEFASRAMPEPAH